MQILLFIFWIIWKKLAIFAWRTLRLFVWVFAELIKLIHSNDRVILGFHGMLGGAIGYLSFGSAAEQLSEQILLVIASGVLSIALGLIGKRFLSEKSQTANGV
jgi:hypothetical protein